MSLHLVDSFSELAEQLRTAFAIHENFTPSNNTVTLTSDNTILINLAEFKGFARNSYTVEIFTHEFKHLPPTTLMVRFNQINRVNNVSYAVPAQELDPQDLQVPMIMTTSLLLNKFKVIVLICQQYLRLVG